MKLTLSSTVATSLLVASAANAQNVSMNATAYAAGVLQALQYNNLTTLLSIAQTNAATLIPLLMSGGNKTIFAPTNAAFAALPENVTSNATLVAQTVMYHIAYGSFPGSALTQGQHTIARTALNDSSLVNLPGGQGQVAVLAPNTTARVTVVEALANVTSVAPARFQNLVIHVIPTVLTVPTSLTSTATAAGLSSLVSALTENAAAAIPALESARGITVFAPVNSAFEGVAQLIGTLNSTDIANVLLNHVINGTAVYSSQVTNGANLTSAGGSPLSFTANSTGTFVTSGSSTARLLRTDIPITNGVVHLIDSVLANPATNPDAASSAASSAASVASTQTAAATGAVGAGGGASPTSEGGAQPSGSQPASSAGKLVGGGVLGGLMAVAGVLAM